MVMQSSNKVRVVVGFAETFSAPEVAWSLIGSGFSVAAFARRGSRAALRVSRCASVFDLTPPEDDAQASVKDLQEKLQLLRRSENSPLVLLPLDDASVWICGQVAPEDGLIVAGPGPDKTDFALDKHRQIQVARESGFRVPETLLVPAGDALGSVKLRFPVIAKPARAIFLRGGKLGRERFHWCRSEADLSSALRTCLPGTPMLIQEHVEGIGEGLFGLAGKAGVLAWSAHRRIRMMNPLGSGASACMSITPDLEDVAAASRLIDLSSWEGLFMVELLRDAAGKTWFVEFNGRVWGSTALARRCGLEYPAWAVLDAIGQADGIPQRVSAPSGIVCRHAGREALHALFVLRGPRSQTPGRWPSRWNTLRKLMTLRRSEYWYNWKREDWRVFIRDFAATLAEVLFRKSRKS
jgi:hypothetical protein